MSKNIKPSVTVNTQEFGTLLRKYRHTEFADNTVARIALISYIDAHIEQAVADAEDKGYATGLRVGLLDGASIIREVYVNHVFHTGVAGLESRCKQTEQIMLTKADAEFQSMPAPIQQPSAEPVVEGFTMDRIAEACSTVGISDSEFESLSIDLLYGAPPAHDNVLSKPAQQDDGELPPLPEPVYLGGDEAFGDVIKGHTDEAMREYGRLCRATRQPPQQATEPLTDALNALVRYDHTVRYGMDEQRDGRYVVFDNVSAILAAAKEKQN